MLMLEDSYGKVNFYKTGGYNHDLTRFNLFQFSLLIDVNFGSFLVVSKIYEHYFTMLDIQQMILKSNTFVAYMIDFTDIDTCKEFFEFAERIFKGNEVGLVEFLREKDPVLDTQ